MKRQIRSIMQYVNILDLDKLNDQHYKMQQKKKRIEILQRIKDQNDKCVTKDGNIVTIRNPVPKECTWDRIADGYNVAIFCNTFVILILDVLQ